MPRWSCVDVLLYLDKLGRARRGLVMEGPPGGPRVDARWVMITEGQPGTFNSSKIASIRQNGFSARPSSNSMPIPPTHESPLGDSTELRGCWAVSTESAERLEWIDRKAEWLDG